MKLRNKKTGQLGNFIINKDHFECVDLDYVPEYRNLAELNEEWEDAEPKEYWFISPIDIDVVETEKMEGDEVDEFNKQIGNYFETKEEAQKAVEKLKAWKRLRDKGFEFVGWEDTNNDMNDILFELPYMEWDKNVIDDLDLLFGGEK